MMMFLRRAMTVPARLCPERTVTFLMRLERKPRRECQFLVSGIIEQDRGRVGTELVHQLFDEDIQRQD